MHHFFYSSLQHCFVILISIVSLWDDSGKIISCINWSTLEYDMKMLVSFFVTVCMRLGLLLMSVVEFISNLFFAICLYPFLLKST